MAETLVTNLVVPEVIADLVETELGARVTLLPVTAQDDTLTGQPGDTLKFPAFSYIGAADAVSENGLITASLLSSVSKPVSVKKYAKAVTLTDEARLSGYGDPVGEAARQLAHAIDHAVDDALFAQLAACPYSRLYPITALSASAIADALTLFGDELEGDKLLLVDPAGFAALRKDTSYIRASDLGQRMIFSGVVGEVWGCQIVVSTKIKADATLKEFRYYIVKPGALRLVNKQGTFLEVKREAEYMRDTLYASKHCAAYLYDDSKVVGLTIPSAIQTILESATGIHCVDGGSGKTCIVIPEAYAPAPFGCKWVYKLSDTTVTLVFGTAVSGYTDWVSSATAITCANAYAHIVLVDAANKPLKYVEGTPVVGL